MSLRRKNTQRHPNSYRNIHILFHEQTVRGSETKMKKACLMMTGSETRLSTSKNKGKRG